MNLGIKQIALLACIVGGLGWVTTLTFARSDRHREYQAQEIERMEKTLTLLANKRHRMNVMTQRITDRFAMKRPRKP